MYLLLLSLSLIAGMVSKQIDFVYVASIFGIADSISDVAREIGKAVEKWKIERCEDGKSL